MNSLRRLPERQQDLLALLLLLLLLAALGLGLLNLRAEAQAARQEADRLAQELLRIERFIETGPKLEAAIRDLAASGAEAASLLPAESANLAGAELQRLLKALVEGKGGRLDSSQLLQPEPEGRFERIAVRLTAALDVAQLQDALLRIESGQPLLFVEEMTLQPVRRGRDADASPHQRPSLNVSLTVYGYILSGGGGDG